MIHKIFLLFIVLVSFTPVIQAEKIKIGGVYSITGFGNYAGEAEMLAAQLAIDEINKSGGIAGKQVKFILEDNASSLKQTASGVSKLLNIDQVSAILGPNWAEFAEIAVPLAERSKTPLITASGNKQGLTKGKKYSFTLFPDHFKTIRKFAKVIAEGNHSKIAMMVAQNAYFEEVADGLEDYFKEVGFTNYERLSTGEDASEYKILVTKLKSKKYDAAISLLVENTSIDYYFDEVLKQGLNIKQYTSLGIKFSPHLKPLYHRLAGVIFYDYKDPDRQQVTKKYEDQYKKPIVFGALRSYDSVYLLKQVIEKCGLSGEAIVKCLAETKYMGTVGQIAFDKDHQFVGGADNANVRIIKDGKFEILVP